MPPLSGAAEGLAVNAAIAFQTAHPNAVATVTDKIGTNSFSVTVTEKDGAYSFTYVVSETANQVYVGFSEHDTTGNTVLVSGENPVQQNGGLVLTQSSPGKTTSTEVVTEVKGVETVYQSPTASASQLARATASVAGEIAPAAVDLVLAETGGGV
jgi:hypothetical protein